MDEFDAYKMFVAIRNHFTTSSYDYFKYRGKTNVTYQSFIKRRDRFMFAKLARLPSAKLRVAASFLEGCQWINEIVGTQGYDALIKHQKYIESYSYHFREQLKCFDQPIGKLVQTNNGQPPLLAALYFQKKIDIETLIIIDGFVDFVTQWSREYSADPLMEKLITDIANFRGFFTYDRNKIKDVFVDYCVTNSLVCC